MFYHKKKMFSNLMFYHKKKKWHLSSLLLPSLAFCFGLGFCFLDGGGWEIFKRAPHPAQSQRSPFNLLSHPGAPGLEDGFAAFPYPGFLFLLLLMVTQYFGHRPDLGK